MLAVPTVRDQSCSSRIPQRQRSFLKCKCVCYHLVLAIHFLVYFPGATYCCLFSFKCGHSSANPSFYNHKEIKFFFLIFAPATFPKMTPSMAEHHLEISSLHYSWASYTHLFLYCVHCNDSVFWFPKPFPSLYFARLNTPSPFCLLDKASFPLPCLRFCASTLVGSYF